MQNETTPPTGTGTGTGTGTDTMPPSGAAAKKAIHFGPFVVTHQVFYQTPHTYALVNLKPILPGHVLVSPHRVTPRVHDLTPTEASDLFLTTQRVGRMIERVYDARALNIAIQDGREAGQSVPHVHAHVIPRRWADLEHLGGSDRVYELLDGEKGDVGGGLVWREVWREFERGKEKEEVEGRGGHGQGQGRSRFPVIEDKERKPRSDEEMAREAEMLAREMEREG